MSHSNHCYCESFYLFFFKYSNNNSIFFFLLLTRARYYCSKLCFFSEGSVVIPILRSWERGCNRKDYFSIHYGLWWSEDSNLWVCALPTPPYCTSPCFMLHQGWLFQNREAEVGHFSWWDWRFSYKKLIFVKINKKFKSQFKCIRTFLPCCIFKNKSELYNRRLFHRGARGWYKLSACLWEFEVKYFFHLCLVHLLA